MANEFDIPTPPPESWETSGESPELPVRDVAELVEQLDFRPSPELTEASQAVIAGLRDGVTAESQLSLGVNMLAFLRKLSRRLWIQSNTRDGKLVR
jgi:hypothetical protein